MEKSLASERLRRRLVRHHAPLALAVAGALALGAGAVPSPSVAYRWSLSTAYVSLGLLVATLAVGPLAALRWRRVPLSFDLRRDLGIWAALVALAHAGVGAFVHMASPIFYVLRPEPYPGRLVLRTDPFGLANYAGILAVGFALVLLATSSDRAIKRIGARRWKRVQRGAYALVALTVFHGAVYQAIESRSRALVLLFGGLVGVAAVAQLVGVRARRAHPSPRPPGRRAP